MYYLLVLGAVYGVCDENSAWPYMKERDVPEEVYFGLKTGQGLIEFKCRSKAHKQQWVDGIRNLLRRVSSLAETENSMRFLSINNSIWFTCVYVLQEQSIRQLDHAIYFCYKWEDLREEHNSLDHIMYKNTTHSTHIYKRIVTALTSSYMNVIHTTHSQGSKAWRNVNLGVRYEHLYKGLWEILCVLWEVHIL